MTQQDTKRTPAHAQKTHTLWATYKARLHKPNLVKLRFDRRSPVREPTVGRIELNGAERWCTGWTGNQAFLAPPSTRCGRSSGGSTDDGRHSTGTGGSAGGGRCCCSGGCGSGAASCRRLLRGYRRVELPLNRFLLVRQIIVRLVLNIDGQQVFRFSVSLRFDVRVRALYFSVSLDVSVFYDDTMQLWPDQQMFRVSVVAF